MKKIVFLLMFMLVGFVVMAQKTALTKQTYTVTKDSYAYKYVGSVPADSLGAVRDSILYPIYVETANTIFYDFKMRIHEMSSPCKVTVQLQAKKFISDNWTTVTTKIYNGVGTDTTLLYTEVTTKQHYNYFQFVMIRGANTARLTDVVGVFKR